jgi:hypothetical protein
LDPANVSITANVSKVANVSNTSERKAFQPLQVSSRENTPLPEVKKRRLAESDQKDRGLQSRNFMDHTYLGL